MRDKRRVLGRALASAPTDTGTKVDDGPGQAGDHPAAPIQRQ
jgi:hypothetical protein